MPLIYSKDIAAVLGLTKTGVFGQALGRFLLWLLSLNKINAIYDKSVANGDESQYLDVLLHHLDVNYHISPAELKLSLIHI